MNPTKRPVQSTRRLMDVAPPAAKPSAAQPAAASGNDLKPTLVGAIPVQQQGGPAAPLKDDDELDKIMIDVNKELKAADKKPQKRHLFSKKAKPVKAVPVPKSQPHPVTPAALPKPKTKAKSPTAAPLAVIFATIAVASLLVTAAFYAYK